MASTTDLKNILIPFSAVGGIVLFTLTVWSYMGGATEKIVAAQIAIVERKIEANQVTSIRNDGRIGNLENIVRTHNESPGHPVTVERHGQIMERLNRMEIDGK